MKRLLLLSILLLSCKKESVVEPPPPPPTMTGGWLSSQPPVVLIINQNGTSFTGYGTYGSQGCSVVGTNQYPKVDFTFQRGTETIIWHGSFTYKDSVKFKIVPIDTMWFYLWRQHN